MLCKLTFWDYLTQSMHTRVTFSLFIQLYSTHSSKQNFCQKKQVQLNWCKTSRYVSPLCISLAPLQKISTSLRSWLWNYMPIDLDAHWKIIYNFSLLKYRYIIKTCVTVAPMIVTSGQGPGVTMVVTLYVVTLTFKLSQV